MSKNTLSGNLQKHFFLNKVITFPLLKRSVILEVICFLFVLLFTYAALSKIIDFQKFRIELAKSPLITNWASFIAWFIPTIEIIISIMLAIPKFRLIALYASFTLMVLFTTYIIAIMKFADFVPCSCGGILQNMSWREHLLFNIAFVLIAIIAVFSSNRHTSTIVKV